MMESDQIKTLTQIVDQLKEIINSLTSLLKADNINNNNLESSVNYCTNCYYASSSVCKIDKEGLKNGLDCDICNHYLNKKDIII